MGSSHVLNVNGQVLISAAGNAILFGVSEDEMKRAAGAGGGVTALPEMWIKSGRRRMREAQAATGSEDLSAIIAWLEARDVKQRGGRP